MRRVSTTLVSAMTMVVLSATVAGSASVTPVVVQGNPTCSNLGLTEVTKFDPPTDGTQNGVTLDASDDGMTVLSWSSDTPIDAVIVKGGPRANVYFYDPAATGDSNLIAPLNKGGNQAALSHVDFCAGAEEPAGVDVQVSLGTCDFVEGESVTPLTVTITGDGEAQVEVLDSEGATVATFVSSDSVDLAPGEYTFITTALNDSELSEGSDTEGTITALDCTPSVEALGSVNVSLGQCVFSAGLSQTPVSIVIAPSGAATVTVDGNSFSGSGGSAQLTPGTYTWTADPAEGFELTGATSGSLTAGECSVVLPRLPTTGTPSPALLALGLVFLAAGAAMSIASRRVAGGVIRS